MTMRRPFERRDLIPTVALGIAGFFVGLFGTSTVLFMFDIGWLLIAAFWWLLLPLLALQLLAEGALRGLAWWLRGRKPEPELKLETSADPETPSARRYAIHAGAFVGAGVVLFSGISTGALEGQFG